MNCELFNLPALSVGHIEMIQELLNIKADWVMSVIILIHLNLCYIRNNKYLWISTISTASKHLKITITLGELQYVCVCRHISACAYVFVSIRTCVSIHTCLRVCVCVAGDYVVKDNKSDVR